MLQRLAKASNRHLFPILYAGGILVLVALIGVTFWIKADMDAWKQGVALERKNHDNRAAKLYLYEEQMDSIYYQQTLNATLDDWMNKKQYRPQDMYELNQLQSQFITIINSVQGIDSIYLHNRNTDYVLSTNAAFAMLNDFPDRDLFTRYYESGDKWQVQSNVLQAGYNRPTDTISLVRSIKNSGAIAINIDTKSLIGLLANDDEGIVLTDQNGQLLGSRHARDYHLIQLNAHVFAADADMNLSPIRIDDSYLFMSDNRNNKINLVSVLPQSGIALSKQVDRNAYLIMAAIVVLAMVIYRYIQLTYIKPAKDYQTNLKSNLEDIQHNFFLNLLSGKLSRQEIGAKAEEMGMPPDASRFVVIVFQINDYYNYILRMSSDDRYFTSRLIYNSIKWHFLTAFTSFAVKVEFEKIAILQVIPPDVSDEDNERHIMRTIEYLQNDIRDNCNLTVCAGISNQVGQLDQVHVGYSQALKAIEYKSLYGKHSIIAYERISHNPSLQFQYPVTDIQKFGALLKERKIDKIKEFLDESLDDLLANKQMSFDLINSFFANTLFEIVKFTLELPFEFTDIMPSDPFITLYSYEVFEDKKHYIVELCEAVIRREQERGTETIASSKTLQVMTDYIDNHFDQRISLTSVADALSMNPTYLSTLMKNELKVGFVDYVNDLRIRKAIVLLRNKELTVQKIAELCGYDTVHSFIRNFKKVHGSTPTEYRSRMPAQPVNR